MISTYLANKILDHINGKTSYTMPVPYFGLFTTYPTGPGNAGVEGTGGSYVRTASSGLWAASASGLASNSAEVAVVGTNQTYVGVGLWDASTAGNILIASKLQSQIVAEVVVLSSGYGATANKPIANVTVKDSTDTTTYTEGTDYYLSRDAGVIIRISTGAITANQTLHITYNSPTTATLPTDGSKIFFPTGYLFDQLVGFQA